VHGEAASGEEERVAPLPRPDVEHRQRGGEEPGVGPEQRVGVRAERIVDAAVEPVVVVGVAAQDGRSCWPGATERRAGGVVLFCVARVAPSPSQRWRCVGGWMPAAAKACLMLRVTSVSNAFS